MNANEIPLRKAVAHASSALEFLGRRPWPGRQTIFALGQEEPGWCAHTAAQAHAQTASTVLRKAMTPAVQGPWECLTSVLTFASTPFLLSGTSRQFSNLSVQQSIVYAIGNQWWYLRVNTGQTATRDHGNNRPFPFWVKTILQLLTRWERSVLF
jgi:hypothetical protein